MVTASRSRAPPLAQASADRLIERQQRRRRRAHRQRRGRDQLGQRREIENRVVRDVRCRTGRMSSCRRPGARAARYAVPTSAQAAGKACAATARSSRMAAALEPIQTVSRGRDVRDLDQHERQDPRRQAGDARAEKGIPRPGAGTRRPRPGDGAGPERACRQASPATSTRVPRTPVRNAPSTGPAASESTDEP